MTIFKNLLLYLLLSLTFIFIYMELSHFWVSCGGISSKIKYVELPIIVVLLLVLYFPTKSILKNSFLSMLPILGLYILFDVFYYFLSRSPRISDLSNAHVLSDFSPLMSIGLVVMLVLIFIPFLYMIYQFKNSYSTFAIKIVSLVGLLYFLGTSQFSDYLFKKFKFYNWSQSKTINKNGRFTSFLYYGLISKQSKEKLTLYKEKNININKILFKKLTLKNKPNIYIVVLESFIDPRLIKDASYDKSPLFDGLKKYLPNGDFSHVISPVYGGGTSQAEFEVLTGIKALAKVSSIEFNTLEGQNISGFTNLLKKNGYNTYANIATYSGYYNSKEAYKSIGFDKTIFLEESEDFQKDKNDEKIFDGDVYGYNIKKLNSDTYKKPYLHYTLGMYGHFPYDRNLEKRSDVIATTYKDKRVKKIANQFYYRTKALAKYIDTILEFDLNSIIYVTSDHIPPLLTNGINYIKPQTENIAFLVVDGKAVDVSGKYYYDIPRIIWKTLNNTNQDIDKINAKQYEEIYFKALSESLE